MKKATLHTVLIITLISFNFTACRDKNDLPKPKPTPSSHKVSPVSQFVYDGLSTYYLWNDEMKDKKPTEKDTDAKKYFQSVLYKTDIEHGWSRITDDVDALLSGFEGESTDAFGFVPAALWADKDKSAILGFVKYVYPNTPAANAGMKRGHVISKINGQNITKSNFHILFGDNQKTTFTVLDQNYQNPKEITIVPGKIETDPVLFSNVYEFDDKKIGYLFYTQFIYKYNNSLYKAFESFKQAGITDLVVDLRYNHGGAVTSASYLASLIAPRKVVEDKSTLAIMSYNEFLNASFDKWYKEAEQKDKYKYDRKDYFGFFGKEQENPLGANLNLNKVYIIATDDSFSASELTTFCLRPYMEVVHIGRKTGGKYTASWTLHPYDSEKGQPIYDANKMASKDKEILKKWAMQPIVARYTDKDGKDFIATNGLIPDFEIESQEYDTRSWKPIGDVEDYLFAKAISLITGRPYNAAPLRSSSEKYIQVDIPEPSIHKRIIKESVVLDNPKISPSELNELLQLRRARIQEEEE